MKYKVVGTQLVDYVSKKTGNPVKGVTLHALCKDSQWRDGFTDICV